MKISHVATLTACVASFTTVWAQDYTDALRFNSNEVLGTARSQAMAGAFGAVGADLTSMSINPAGMAVYRATELGFTLGVNVVKDESEFFQKKSNTDRVKVALNQLGAGFSFGRMREAGGGAVAHNIFIGYNRLADFNNKQSYEDAFSKNSLLDYFCMDEQKLGSLTGGLAYDAYLTNDTTIRGTADKFTYNVWEEFVGDGVNPFFREDEAGDGLVHIRKRITEDGSKGDIPIGYAVNISNKFYIGGSINIRTISYERNTIHSETFDGYTVNAGDPTEFSYLNHLDQDAAGVGFNLGVIYRPIPALRVGFALHSPTFYSVSEKFWASVTNPALRWPTVNSDEYEYDYKYRSPSRFVASVAAVFERIGMVSFDYERTNNQNSKFSVDNDDDYDYVTYNVYDDMNSMMKDEVFEASNTIRVGAELSLLKPLYVRAGYRQTSNSVKKPFYVNKAENYAYSGGLGFRRNNFFIDLTYVCAVKKNDHWVLPDSAEPYTYETNSPAWLTQTAHSGVLTMGFRF